MALLALGMAALAQAAEPPAPAAAAEVLRPFSATYAWTLRGMNAGTSTVTLRSLEGGRWSYASRSVARGLFRLVASGDITQDSRFRIVDDRIVPDHYRGDDGTDATRRDVDLHFDWKNGRVTGIYEQVPVDLPAEAGLLDDMSIQATVMRELLRGRAPQGFRLVHRNVVRDYVYSREREEILDTPLGRHATVVYRSQRVGARGHVLFWCAPELGYLPLRVERRTGEGKIDWAMNVRSLTR
ncbi:MAG: hypothetical protein RL026_177 [Pseudomonadota bacterium]